ncbi:hypothetical protein [Bacillus safensis]|uniref:hypothetical protein n=1 Tax=Bacillus safensis TaxID=561879 RepID=UPI0020CD478B|nr:hypothetical protein [Bacillus safensis]MCP9283007.1 hypothetical protein [Bacillus safensis]
MTDIAAVCSGCGSYMTEKVYEPYVCADCKIKSLEEDLTKLKEERDYINCKYRKSDDESMALRKYKGAFEMLVSELAKK